MGVKRSASKKELNLNQEDVGQAAPIPIEQQVSLVQVLLDNNGKQIEQQADEQVSDNFTKKSKTDNLPAKL